MKRILLYVLLSFSLLMSTAHASPFSDVPPNHWARAALDILLQKGIVIGFPYSVYSGNRSLTRYEMALIIARILPYLETDKTEFSKQELETLKNLFAEYQDEVELLGLRVRHLEQEVSQLQDRLEESERVRYSGDFSTRAVSTSMAGNTRRGVDTANFFENQNRPYPFFPLNPGSAITTRADLNITTKVSENWEVGGTLSAYNAVGDSLNALTWGVTPPYFNNPLEGYTSFNNFRANLDHIFFQNKNQTMQAEIGSFHVEHSPDYFYAGVPNLTDEGPAYLPNFGGRFESDLNSYLLISKAFSEFFAGKIGQASPWQTDLYGTNLGIDVLGLGLNFHWMNVLNDPAPFPAGTSGLIPSPINGGVGWLNPASLTPLVVGPQEQKMWGVDFSYKRELRNHSILFYGAYATTDYKPNTNSSNNAKGEFHQIGVEGDLLKSVKLGIEYLQIDAKYSPFILPFSLPIGVSINQFPWAQWPFMVDYPGYFTLQNAQEFPQNREGIKTYLKWEIPQGDIEASYRSLTQEIPTELTAFSNDVDLQSIGFYEPLFVASGAPTQVFPKGTTQDANLLLHYKIKTPLLFQLGISDVRVERRTNDANNINLNGWLGNADFIYSFLERWKFDVGYNQFQTYGRYLASTSSPNNYQALNHGEKLKLDYGLNSKSDAFMEYQIFDHNQIQGGVNFHSTQLLTGLGFSF